MIPVRHLTGDVNGLTVSYREAGPKDAPTIVLLHGFPSSSHMFRNLIPALADRYHVIAPDHIGFGYSSVPSIEDVTEPPVRAALSLESTPLYVNRASDVRRTARGRGPRSSHRRSSSGRDTTVAWAAATVDHGTDHGLPRARWRGPTSDRDRSGIAGCCLRVEPKP
jgi:pimeloyl-ACP methyl ester carboxylesterase